MSRYIDADAVVKALYAMCLFPNCQVAERIAEAPTIDIVRCKECRWFKKWKTIGRDDGYCGYARMTQDGLQYINTNPNDYCSMGERKSDE